MEENKNITQTSVSPQEFLDDNTKSVDEKPVEKSEDKKIETVDVDPNNLEEVERTREPDVDLEQFRLKMAKIESVDTIRINSPYAKSKDGKVHKLKVTGEIVHTLEKEGQKDIEFRPSELLDLDEDDEGNNPTLPINSQGRKLSKWQSLKKALNIDKPLDAIGKVLPMRINHNNKNDKDYLGFMYL